MFHLKFVFNFIILIKLPTFCITYSFARTTAPKIVCYWNSDSIYRNGSGFFQISDINPELCTHLIYGYGELTDNYTISPLDADFDKINMFTSLKATKNSPKVMLGIGGTEEDTRKFESIVLNLNSHRKFADNVVEILTKNSFQGLDLYLSNINMNAAVFKKNFIYLLKVLQPKLYLANLLLSATVKANVDYSMEYYSIKPMCMLLKFINLMTYNLESENEASLQAPLSAGNLTYAEKYEVIQDIVQHFKRQGCVQWKIVMGIPAFGRSYILRDAQMTDVGAPIIKRGPYGRYTKEIGFLGYNEICEFQREEQDWHIKYLEKNAAIYAWRNNLWVSYDDKRTIDIKGDYVRTENLGGFMLWSIDTDDYRGFCGEKYPLLKAIKESFNILKTYL